MQGALTHSGKSSQPFSTPENSHPQWSVEAVLGSLLSSCFGEREIILQRLIQHLPCYGFSGVRTYWSEFCRTSSLHINRSFEPGNAECRKSGILSMDSPALIKSPYPNDPKPVTHILSPWYDLWVFLLYHPSIEKPLSPASPALQLSPRSDIFAGWTPLSWSSSYLPSLKLLQ